MVDGQNQQSRAEKAQEFQGGDVHLLDSNNAIADNDTTANPNATATTADADWSISHDNAAGTTTLENVNSIDFGSVSGFTLDQVLVESSDTAGNFIIDNAPTGDTDFSGDGDVSIEPGNLSYTLGSE